MINIKPGGVLGAVLDQVAPAVKEVKKQVTGESLEKEKGEKKEAVVQKNEQRQKETDEIVKKMYETSEDDVKNLKPADQSVQVQPAASNAAAVEQKSPEEMQKIEQLKQQLHQQTYFDPTFNRKPEEKEEVVEEQKKKQEEEQMELMKKEEKKKKKGDSIAVQREKNKAEQFRGAAG